MASFLQQWLLKGSLRKHVSFVVCWLGQHCRDSAQCTTTTQQIPHRQSGTWPVSSGPSQKLESKVEKSQQFSGELVILRPVLGKPDQVLVHSREHGSGEPNQVRTLEMRTGVKDSSRILGNSRLESRIDSKNRVNSLFYYCDVLWCDGVIGSTPIFSTPKISGAKKTNNKWFQP